MKKYIEENLTPILFGFVASNLIWMSFNLIESIVLKIAILINQ